MKPAYEKEKTYTTRNAVVDITRVSKTTSVYHRQHLARGPSGGICLRGEAMILSGAFVESFSVHETRRHSMEQKRQFFDLSSCISDTSSFQSGHRSRVDVFSPSPGGSRRHQNTVLVKERLRSCYFFKKPFISFRWLP